MCIVLPNYVWLSVIAIAEKAMVGNRFSATWLLMAPDVNAVHFFISDFALKYSIVKLLKHWGWVNYKW